MVTAGVVFAGGMALLPSVESAPPPEPAPAPSPPTQPQPARPPPAPPPTPTPAQAPAAHAESAAAPAGAPANPDAAPAVAAPPVVVAAPTPAPAAARLPVPAADGPAHQVRATREAPAATNVPAVDSKGLGRDKMPDKDVAREAWRKNLPDIAADTGKATILIPIKGSIQGATYRITAKPRGVLVMLPQGESLITMPFYSIRHDGFRQLWIKQEQGQGTTLRVVLGEATEPTVEIKDDFVRVAVRRPTAADAPPAGAPGTAPAPATPSAPSPAPAAPPAAPASPSPSSSD